MGWCVQGIAKYGVTNGLHVHTQLVAASGQGLKLHPAALALRIVRHAAPAGLAGFAIDPDDAQGAVGPIDGDR